MHILVVNDDGPPSNLSSPYVHSLVDTLQAAGHIVSVVLPNVQRSWIGKAHLVGETIKPTYYRPGDLHKDNGTIHNIPLREERPNSEEQGGEWILIDSTPASCVQIGLYHYFKDRGPIDLVVSGPNYGRNTTAVYTLSSGTIGGAMEGAICGKKAIAVSYAFSSRDHDPVVIAEASKHATRLIEHLYQNWTHGIDVYNINIPLECGVSQRKILYANILDNRWVSGSSFEAINAEQSGSGASLQEHELRTTGEVGELPENSAMGKGYYHKHFKWAPRFADVFNSINESEPGNDGWVVKMGCTSVTPLRANFMHVPVSGEIKLPPALTSPEPAFYAIVQLDDSYVQPLVLDALEKQIGQKGTAYKLVSSLDEIPDQSSPVLQFRIYEKSNFQHVLSHPSTSCVNSYIIRKTLTRKHYLTGTVENWIAKRPSTKLIKHMKPCATFELDYAEFLDDALIDCYELVTSFDRNEGKKDEDKEWWILKPGMSDRGQGIRIFDSEDSLRQIFEEWEAEAPDPDDDDGKEERNFRNKHGDESSSESEEDNMVHNGVVASQLRFFVAQPYIHPPLLLPSEANRKFHIRTYVLAVGSLKVYVYREMLALFAEKPYAEPWEANTVADLTRHLTNTCLQNERNGSMSENSVRLFWALPEQAPGVDGRWKNKVYDQICSVTGEIFQAAAQVSRVHFQTLPNAFEIFGVDFLVDASGNTWLLELNAFPDFRQTGDELRTKVVGGLFDAVVAAAIRPFFGIAEKEGEQERLASLGLQKVVDMNLGIK